MSSSFLRLNEKQKLPEPASFRPEIKNSLFRAAKKSFFKMRNLEHTLPL